MKEKNEVVNCFQRPLYTFILVMKEVGRHQPRVNAVEAHKENVG